MDTEINTDMGLGIHTDITTSSLTLPTPLALAASLITTALLLSLRAILKGFTSNPYIPFFTPGVSASYALSVCAGAVSVWLCPGKVPTAVTKSTCQRWTVTPVITLTVTVEDLPRIVVSAPAEEEEDAAGAGVRRLVAGIAEDKEAAVHEMNASTSLKPMSDVDVDAEGGNEDDLQVHEEETSTLSPAEPVFNADAGVEPSDNDADVHGQNTSTSAPAEPTFDLFTQLRAIAQSRAACQTAVRNPERFETALHSMLASLTPTSTSSLSSPSPPASPDTEQTATPSDVDVGGEATMTPTSQSPSSAETQTKRFKFDFDWSDDVEEEEERCLSENVVMARLPSGEELQEMLAEKLRDTGAC
jgi:hypothetical protein